MREVPPPKMHLIPEFDEAEAMFDNIIQTDPYRLDDLDVYSNILYVMEKSSKLAYLAQLATRTDKFRVETCCIVGLSTSYARLTRRQLLQLEIRTRKSSDIFPQGIENKSKLSCCMDATRPRILGIEKHARRSRSISQSRRFAISLHLY